MAIRWDRVDADGIYCRVHYSVVCLIYPPSFSSREVVKRYKFSKLYVNEFKWYI